MARPLRKLLIAFAGLAVLAALLYKFRNSIALEGIHWDALLSSIRHTRVSLLVLSLATIYVCLAIRALRWGRFSRRLGTPSFSGIYKGTLMGFASLFLLGRVGEPIRPILIARKEKLPITGMFGVYVLERVFDSAAAAVLAGVALLTFSRHTMQGDEHNRLIAVARTAGALLLAGLVAVTAFLIYFRLHGAAALERKLDRLKERGGWRAKLSVLMSGFSDGLRGIHSLEELGLGIFYTALHWTLVAAVYLWVAWSFGGKLGTLQFSGAMLVLAFTLVGSALQLPGIGGGAQVATFLVLTVIFGVEKEPAAADAILTWLVTFAGACIVGLPLLFHEGWSMGELRQLAQAEERAEESGRHIVNGDTRDPGAVRQ